MKLGVITVLFGDRPLDEALAYLKSLGIEELEVGAGGYPGKAHCDPAVLLADEKKLEEFKATFEKYAAAQLSTLIALIASVETR